ncbi:MAG: universal stress protein [Myxococcales bacterium]|nr:universal stress protein [Myxococcales bacterium]
MTTKLFEHIVIGYDFSESCRVALHEAVRLAQRHKAKLTLFHAIDDLLIQYNHLMTLSPPELEAAIRESAQKDIDDHIKILGGSVIYEVHISSGKPYQSLLEFCQTQSVSLLVIGKTGASAIERVLLGSTAERLLRYADVPVLVVRPDKEPGFSNILVPVDFSELSQNSLKAAFALAINEGASIEVLHIVEFGTLPLPAGVGAFEEALNLPMVMQDQAREELERFLADFDFGDIQVNSHLSVGIPDQEITHYAEEKGCDLIVMGSVGRTGFQGFLLGNTAERVSRRATCSLLTIKPPHLT